MGWSIELRRPEATLTLDANIAWKWRAGATPNGDNQVGAVDHRIDLEGEIIDDDPDTIGETFFEYLEQIADNFEPVEVAILQDGDERRVLKIEDGFIGPFVTNFERGGDGDSGEGESKLTFAMTIEYRSKGGISESNKDVAKLSTALETTKRNGRIIRKVWKVSLIATSQSAAEGAVKLFKPSETFVIEQINVIVGDEIRGEGMWVWEVETKGVTSWKCKIVYSGGVGYGYLTSADPSVPPTRYLLAGEPIDIEVEGEIIALTPEIVLPEDHFKTSADIVRVPRRERLQRGTQIYNAQEGKYVREYHEVYECIGKVPDPVHSGNHDIIPKEAEPGDGKVSR